MTLQLVALRGPLVGRTFTLGPDGLWMGRTLEAPIPLGSHLASRRHAEVRLEGSVPVMRDLGSINGTRVNGERVQVRPLQIGDVIEIGDEAFRLVTGEVSRPAATYGNVVGLRGPLAGREVPVGDAPVTFGRALDCSLVIQSQRASRKHAEIRLEPAGPTLIDLRSGNGTLVNGERVPTRLLEHGDVIEIGDEAFRFDAAATSIRARTASPLASSMPSLAPEVPPKQPARPPSAAAPTPGAAPSATPPAQAPPWAAPATNAPPWAAPATSAPWSAPATSAPWSGGPTTAEPPWASQPTSVPGWAAPATNAGPAVTGPHTPFPGAPSAPPAPPAPAWNAPPPVGPPPPPPTAPQAQPAAPPWTPPPAAAAPAAPPPPAPAPAGPPTAKPKRSLRGTMPMPASSPLANAPSAPAPPAPPPLSRGPVLHTAPMPQSPAPGAAPQNPGAAAVGIRCPQCRRVVDARYRDCPWDGTSLANGEIVR